MVKNYFIVALRHLQKYKVFSLINVIGLSIGIACCLMLALYIKDEVNYEKHFADGERIYRLYTTLQTDQGREDKFPRTSPPIVMTMLEEFPELETATRLVNPPEVEQHLVRFQDKTFFEKKGYLVDSTFFDVFDYAFKEGDRFTALDGPSTVVISDELAQKLFASESALDNLIIINSGNSTDTFRVTGVLKTPLYKSHVDAGLYMCMNSRGWGEYINSVTTWAGQNFIYSYVKLRPGTTSEMVEAKLPTLIDQHGAKDLKELGIRKKINLQALLDTHLYSDFSDTYILGTSGNITNLYILGSIGLFILLIACINFMNLTTAKGSQRAGEVGIRKSLGATRQSLVQQFLGESLTIVFVSMILALGIVQLVLPFFNELTHKELSISFENMGYMLLALLGITLITGFLAGCYPAFFLSSFQPAKVLKDKRYIGGGSNWLRKSMVVFQFVISITLIASILIMQQQMKFMHNQPLGFNPDYKIMIPMRTEEAKKNYHILKDKVSQIAGVTAISASSALPSTPTLRDLPLYAEGSSMEKAQRHLNVNIDENYFSLLHIPLIAGRDLIFSKDSVSFRARHSPANIIVNRASLNAFNIDLSKAIGQRLYIDWQGQKLTFEIIGVVEDFHQASMHEKILPTIFIIPAEQSDFVYAVAAVKASNYSNLLEQLQAIWKEVAPGTPFESNFLVSSIQKQYEADQREMMMITVSTLLAIFISCLGLYGLSIHVAERKVKEIGIRKVLGASVTGIVAMLSKDFIKLVMIAFVLAAPLAYYSMTWWLQKFAFKIEPGLPVLVFSGVLSFVIAWLTVGFESLRAAMGNPVNSLHNE